MPVGARHLQIWEAFYRGYNMLVYEWPWPIFQWCEVINSRSRTRHISETAHHPELMLCVKTGPILKFCTSSFVSVLDLLFKKYDLLCISGLVIPIFRWYLYNVCHFEYDQSHILKPLTKGYNMLAFEWPLTYFLRSNGRWLR